MDNKLNRETKTPPQKPIGVIASLASGFDTVIQGWWVILFPVLLDLFLWFGPRLSIVPVVNKTIASLTPLLGENAALDLLREAGAELNYFSTLSVTPLGVPNLMSLKLPQATPLGAVSSLSISSELPLLALFIGLSLAGLLIGGIYLGLIAQQVRDGRPDPARLLRLLPRYWLSVLALVVGLLLVGTVLAVPTLLIAALGSMISPLIGTLVIWVAFMLFLWLAFHLFFAIHGLLLREDSLINASWTSLRLVAFNSFPTMALLTLVLALSAGLNYVWVLPKDDSWMLLLGVAGHGVISSGLIAATFVFYQDRFRYWRELQDFFAGKAKNEILETKA